ncbi:MAG: pitrilysin family protein [Pelistega sp.]|nr:pitrilysin family protein [Pelistega sp.]
MFKLLLISVLFMLSTVSQAFTKIQSIEGITEYQLNNGLQILLVPDISKPSTTVNMTYRVGSRHERYGQTGMAHLLEHLVFRGTESYPDALQQFSEKGLNANGSTNTERTNYYAIFASDNATLEWYLRWQADVMQNLRISTDDLKKEVDIVLNERERSQNNPMQVLFERIKSSAYHWSNAGTPIIGSPDDLKAMQAKDLQDFYHTYYQPDNATLVITGSFDEAQTMQLIETIFAPIKKLARDLQEAPTLEPIQDGERNIILRQTGNMPFVANAYHIPSAAHKDYVALDMAVNILSDRPSGLLYRELVQDKKTAANTFGLVHTQYHSGLAFFGAQLNDNKDITTVTEQLNQLLENLAAHPLTEEELQRARTYWLNQWQKLYANTEHLGIGLSEAIAAGDWRLFFLERDYVKAVTLAEVQQAAEQYFVPSNRISGQYIPTEKAARAPKIERPDLATIFADYKGDPTHQLIEAFDTSAENIQAKTQKDTITLDNGTIQYALLPKPTRGNRVFANYRIKFSELDKLSGQATLSSFAASLITSGTDTLSQQDIQDTVDELNGSLSYHISGNQLVVSLSSTQEHIAELLAFSLSLIQHANYPEQELNNFITQVRRAIKANSDEPASKASHALNRYLSDFASTDFRYVASPEEQLAAIDRINRNELISFNRKNFGAGNIDVSIVGAFEPQTIIQTLQTEISQWSTAPRYQYIADPYGDYAPQEFVIKTPEKANAIFIGKLLLPIQNNDADFPALVVANHLLGGSEASRLFQAVRADKGLSYSVNSGINASSFEPSAEWTIQAIYSPTNREVVRNTIIDTVKKASTEGFTQEELNKGIAAIINLRSLARAQDNVLSSTWLRYLESGRDFKWNKAFEEKVKALTLAEVNAVAKKYFNIEKMSMAFAGDF